ncbi:uncharacterized protein [Triticum aestivum]|uniref:uncharacterized protein n=1 Tax=Triticum aestivum TaxID=4565 RepID=UPI001D002CB0|nr:uncharacterized protein LOC123116439 [Triticum aestivum]
MEAAAAGFATGARGAAAARPFGLDLQAAAGGVRRRRRAIPMPAAGPRGGHLPLATARSAISAAHGGLGSAGVVTGLDPALEISSRAVGLGPARSASMIQARPNGHLACGRRVSHLPLRGFRPGGTHRSAAAVGFGGAPRWLVAAAAAAGGGGSGSFGRTFAGVPLHIQAVYSPSRAQAVDKGAPSDDKGEEKLSPIDEFNEVHPRLSAGCKLVAMGMCVVFCYISAKGDPRATLLVTTLKDAGEVSKFLADVLVLLKKLFFPGSGPKR